MILRHVPDARLGEERLRGDLGDPVEGICDHPVEHLHEKGKFLHHTAVQVVGELGGIGRVDDSTTAAPFLGRVFRGGHDFAVAEVVALE